MAHQLGEDVSRVSHPQSKPGFKGKQTLMEDVVTKADTDSPPPTVYVVDGESSSAAPPLDCYMQGCALVSPACSATSRIFLSSGWQAFHHMLKRVFPSQVPALRSFMSAQNGVFMHPGNTANSAQTHWRCDCCEEIIKHLEHELARSTVAHHHHQHSYCMQGHVEMLHRELRKANDETKLFRDETDLQKSNLGAQIQVALRDIDQLSSLNENLRCSLTISASRNEELARKIESLEQEKAKALSVSGSYIESLAIPQLLETAVQRVEDALGSFSKELMPLMELRNWNMITTAIHLVPPVRFSRLSHMKFLIQSHICGKLFRGFEREDFDIITSQFLSFDKRQAEYFSEYKMLSSLQASELMDLPPETPALKDFIHYCHKNYVDIVSRRLENIVGNDTYRINMLKQGTIPVECELLYQTFFRLSKLVWALDRLAFSFEPQVHLFRVERGAKFDGVYIRSIVTDDENNVGLDVETAPTVEFVILLGFRMSKCVVKSQVYLSPDYDEIEVARLRL